MRGASWLQLGSRLEDGVRAWACAPVSATPPLSASHSINLTFPLCTAFLPSSRSSSPSSVSSLPVFSFFASRIPLSSKVSRIAASRYASLSSCRSGESGAGISPSCLAERVPPGKTCAEGKDDDACTRWSSRIWFVGDIRRTLASVNVYRRAFFLGEADVPGAWPWRQRHLGRALERCVVTSATHGSVLSVVCSILTMFRVGMRCYGSARGCRELSLGW